jgi:hypothetical protein|tara:strand:+ start:107 stop:352 length:246 start_codon:yes stop_codon:yes gene_type:complete
MKLKIRTNGKYYQLGYYELSRWINLKQLGTPKKVLELVCFAEWVKKHNLPLFEAYQKLNHNLPLDQDQTHQKKNTPLKPTL